MIALSHDELEDFLNALQEKVHEHYAKFMPEHKDWAPQLSFDKGSRYWRIVSNPGEGRGGRSAFGFLDTETGDVLKCAGWKKPARRKHIKDDNLRSPTGGLSRIRWTGVF